ncbi:ionotropic receptor 25a-like [Palaemon carinicauda]|uniref:ionotropic receptor 25a-like n=1 Tax=Palaemon carinicauda TaxID=392227 RepID=UPI0035B65510
MDGVTLLSRAPKEKNRALAVFSSFTTEVWMSIVIITIIVGVTLTIQAWITNKYAPWKSERFTLGNVLFSVTRSILKQDALLSAKGNANVTLTLWYIFGLILSVLYSGMMTATLAKPSFEKPIDSLHDLPEAVAKGYTLVVVEGSLLEYIFKVRASSLSFAKCCLVKKVPQQIATCFILTIFEFLCKLVIIPLSQYAKGGIYAETWKLFNHEDRSKSFVPTAEDKIDKILTEKLTFIRSELRAKILSEEVGPHLVHISREVFYLRPIGIACFAGAPFVKNFNKVLTRMGEGGLVDKWLNDEFLKINSNITVEEETRHRAFTVMQLQAAFYLVFLGYTLSGIALAFEYFIKKFAPTISF